MERIFFYITSVLMIPIVMYVLIKKDKSYGNPKIAFWNLAFFLSWFVTFSHVFFRFQIENIHIWLIIGLGQFILVTSLARYFIDKEKKKINS